MAVPVAKIRAPPTPWMNLMTIIEVLEFMKPRIRAEDEKIIVPIK